MIFVWILFFIFLILSFVSVYFTIKYNNPYKLIFIFGKKGSGKTTFLTAIAQKHIKQGRPVFSTVDIPGTYKIYPEDIGFVQMPEGSVVLMDEVGMIYDNRNYKQFKPEVRDYFKLQRHYKHTVYMFSQTWDIDIKLRTLTDKMYILVNLFGWISYAKEIRRKLVVVKPSENAESRIADELVIPPFFLAPFGARKVVFIPKYVKYFNSYDAPELDHKHLVITPYPAGVRDPLHKKRKRRKKHEK